MQVIDALLITLGLDSSKFQKGQKDVQDSLKKTKEGSNKVAKDMEADGKQAAQFFSKLRNEAIAFTAALVGANGVKNFVSHIVTGDAALGRFSKNVGMSADRLSAWEMIADRTGGSSDGMANSVKNMASQMQQLKLTGTNGMLPFLIQAGVNIAKFNAESTSMEDRLFMLGDAFKAMPDAKAQFLGGQMGFDEGTINVLKQGRSALQSLLIEQEKLGHSRQGDVDSALALAAAWDKLSQSAISLGRSILTQASPPLLKFMGLIESALDKAKAAVLGPAPGEPVPKPYMPRGVKNPAGLFDYPLKWWNSFNESSKNSTQRSRGNGLRPSIPTPSASASAPTSTAALFAQLETQWGLPAGLLDQVWRQESGRGKNKIGKLLKNGTRAMGDFQLTEDTAKDYGVKDRMSFTESAPAVAHILSDLLKHFKGDLPKALAGYNWGRGNVDKYGIDNLNPESSGFVRDIMAGGRFIPSAQGGRSSTTVHIDRIEINTQATDAGGIAKDIRPALRLSMQTDSGLN